MANDRIENIFKARPDVTNELSTTLSIAAADLAGYAYTQKELEDIAPSDRWNAQTPSVRLALLGLTANKIPKWTALSAAAVKASALTSGQGLRVTIKLANLANKPLAVGVFVANAAGAEHYLADIYPIPAESLRGNAAHGSDYTVDIARRPNSNQPSASEITSKLSNNNLTVYGVITYKPDLGLGPDGASLITTPESFTSSTNGTTSTFAPSLGAKVQLSINPATEGQLEELMKIMGFSVTGGSKMKGGSPESFTPEVDVLDFDLSPYINASGRNRVMVFGVANKTTEESTLQKAFNSKEPTSVTLNVLPTDFIPVQNLISYSRI
jgi:hypothetical protein